MFFYDGYLDMIAESKELNAILTIATAKIAGGIIITTCCERIKIKTVTDTKIIRIEQIFCCNS